MLASNRLPRALPVGLHTTQPLSFPLLLGLLHLVRTPAPLLYLSFTAIHLTLLASSLPSLGVCSTAVLGSLFPPLLEVHAGVGELQQRLEPEVLLVRRLGHVPDLRFVNVFGTRVGAARLLATPLKRRVHVGRRDGKIVLLGASDVNSRLASTSAAPSALRRGGNHAVTARGFLGGGFGFRPAFAFRGGHRAQGPLEASLVVVLRTRGTRDVRKRCERGSGGVALASSRGSEDVRDALQYSEVHKNRVRRRARRAHVVATSATRASSARKVPSGKSQQTGAKEIPFRGSPGFTCLRPLPTNCERVVPAPERVRCYEGPRIRVLDASRTSF